MRVAPHGLQPGGPAAHEGRLGRPVPVGLGIGQDDVAHGPRVLSATGKKAWFTHEMYAGTEPAADADPVATIELLALHVDQAAGRATPFPDSVLATLGSLTEEPPSWAGRSVGAPTRARP